MTQKGQNGYIRIYFWFQNSKQPLRMFYIFLRLFLCLNKDFASMALLVFFPLSNKGAKVSDTHCKTLWGDKNGKTRKQIWYFGGRCKKQANLWYFGPFMNKKYWIYQNFRQSGITFKYSLPKKSEKPQTISVRLYLSLVSHGMNFYQLGHNQIIKTKILGISL